jgi:hypothetical protein
MGDESGGGTTKDIIDAVKGVAEAVPIYDDMVQPAAKELGKGLLTIAKTVNVALSPLAGMVWGYEKIMDLFIPKLEERLKNVPTENIVTPKISVAGPILEALRYTGSEESLSDLYANLLATSMDKETATTAHPAFAEIIKQLTPDEARIIALFPSDPFMPLIDIKRRVKTADSGGAYYTMLVNHSHLGNMAGCEHLDLVPAYLDNLVRLGLAEIPSGQSYISPGIYESLENSATAKSFKESIERSRENTCEFGRKFLEITALGKQFAKVCVVPKS